MSLLKVLWSEGLALDAQHLQQLDRYHEARLRHIAAAINPLAWGVQSARWSLDAILSNRLSAQALALIFRDGEVYQAPLHDALPLAVDLNSLPADQHSFVFYAALPVVKAHGGNLANDHGRAAESRYALHALQTPDLYTEGLSVNVSYLRKTVRLLSQFDARDAYDCIPVLKLRRRADKRFEIDPGFMAASLTVDADPALQEMLRSLLAKLSAKAEALYLLQRQPKGHVVEAHSGNVTSFGMLSTVTSASAALTYLDQLGHCHPARLFEQMMTVAGGLMAFSKKYTMADLPRYEHEQPAAGFGTLYAIIAELLDTVVSSRYLTIPLSIDQEQTQYHQGQLEAGLTEKRAALYIAVSANMPALNLVAEVPRQLKIAAPGDLEILVRRALPGLELLHMAQVPMEVPVRPNAYYFSLESRGEIYEAILKAQAIAIYAPSTLVDLRLELFAIAD